MQQQVQQLEQRSPNLQPQQHPRPHFQQQVPHTAAVQQMQTSQPQLQAPQIQQQLPVPPIVVPALDLKSYLTQLYDKVFKALEQLRTQFQTSSPIHRNNASYLMTDASMLSLCQ